ncbi:MAG: alpha-amylase family glycosyl hydrolase [Armatimonadetes bacterium]|nr:alpha-amylase family glycosyl hydrolase [Armatimonadota bacterium]MDW8153374.1 alpha-amylase family glycosyl hydrolase [Armatimonadota bacterium]
MAGLGPRASWWRRAVVYHIYVRSFQDTDEDGVGDLPGILRRLDYLADLGVEAVWLSPFYPSPQRDFGYDVADYCGVDPVFGTLADFDRLLMEAHARGLRVILDLVANHTSNLHPWFVESRGSRTSAKRDWYVWRDPHPNGGHPNNWLSFFGGPAWTLDPQTEQYYLHHFLPEQPDLNYRNPEVLEAMLEVMRFWLERGVDGFRVDAAALLVEDEHFRDEPPNPAWRPGMRERDRLRHVHTEHQPETHEVLRRFRALLDQYSEPGRERVLIGEVYAPFEILVAYYGSPEAPECHFPFNFALMELPPERWTAEDLQALVGAYESIVPGWAWPSWVLGNHDRPRVASRLGEERTRLAHLLLLTLRGTPTLYYGDELGLRDLELSPDQVQDLPGFREHGGRWSRDAARAPMPWDGSPGAGFTVGTPWLPLPVDFPVRNVASQEKDPHSMLRLLRRLLHLRRQTPALTVGAYRSLPAPPGVYAYERFTDSDRVLVAVNLTGRMQTLEASGEILLSTHLDRFGPERAPLGLRPQEGILLRPTGEVVPWR